MYIALILILLSWIAIMIHPTYTVFYISIFFLIVFGLIALVKLAEDENKKILDRDNKIKQKLKTMNFSISQMIMDKNNTLENKKNIIHGIAIDEKNKKICLITYNNLSKLIDLCVLEYKDILSSEIFVDGVTITKTSRSSQIGGALIGDLLFGSVGAVIGGLSGGKVSSEEVKKIDLQIVVNRTSNPIHDINFLNTKCKKNGITYNKAMEKVRHWHGLLAILIKQADLEDAKKEKDSEPSKGNSIADELSKLAELCKQGLLTEEEFKTQKTKLLKNS